MAEPLTVTFRKAREWNACDEGYRKIARKLGGITKYGRDTPIEIGSLFDDLVMSDIYWLLSRSAYTQRMTQYELNVLRRAEKLWPLEEPKGAYLKDLRKRIKRLSKISLSGEDYRDLYNEITYYVEALGYSDPSRHLFYGYRCFCDYRIYSPNCQPGSIITYATRYAGEKSVEAAVDFENWANKRLKEYCDGVRGD